MKPRAYAVRLGRVVAPAVALVALACSGPPDNGTYRLTPPPGPPSFNVVSDALELHCGTLNCHGNDGRNMRIFGLYGIRLSPKDKTGFGSTSDAEYEANFESLIAIEPEKLSQIVQKNGANVDKWIVLSKGRGTEHHKGGSRLVPGDPTDICLISWVVSGTNPAGVNTAKCTEAATVLPPGTDWDQQPLPQ